MKRSHTLIAAAGIAVAVTACDGLTEAFTAHVDVVARVGSQELSTERLGAMIGNSQIPVQGEFVKAIADLWVNYQLVALAAARGDSLNATKLIDEVMWAQIAQLKARKFFMQVRETFQQADTTGLEQRYAQGEMLAAAHILFAAPENGLSQRARDSIRNEAERVRARATAANFAELAEKYSMDPGSASQGGVVGVFATGAMVPQFEAGVRALQPGQISTALVQSDYGYHIIRRPAYAEVAQEFADSILMTSDQRAEAAYYEQLETEAKLTVKPAIGDKVRAVAKDPEAFLNDRFVLASSRKGDFTAAKLAKWILAFPPQAQIRPQLQQGSDESLVSFVQAMVRNDLLVAKADEAKVTADSVDIANVHASFRLMVLQAWAGLGVDPSSIGDSARSNSEKERVVAGRVDDFLDQLLKTGGQGFVDVPQPLADALRSKYSARVNAAGIDRATERAMIVRATLDSTRARGGPSGGPSLVPMTPPAGARPPGGQP